MPSNFDTLTVYVVFDNHRTGDFTPYAYASNDGGKTFKSIAAGLPNDSPADYLRAFSEDVTNRDLLFVGSSLSVYVSLNRGASWTKFAANLPSVPVYDLKVHPRDGELIAATHGRGFWIVNISPLQNLTATTVASNVQLFPPTTAFQWIDRPTLAASGNGNAQMFFATPSPQYGAAISYRLATAATGTARVMISDARGDTIATLTGPGAAGIHTVFWGYSGTRRVTPPAVVRSPSEVRDSILRAVRLPHVLDSLQKAKYDSAALARVRELLMPAQPAAGAAAGAGAGGRGGGGGGGRGGQSCHMPLTQWEEFCARPGESAAGGGGGGGGRGGAPVGPESERVRRVFDIVGLRVMGGGGGRGGGGGGFGGGGFGGGGFGGGAGGGFFQAGPGEYLVTLVVGGQTQKQPLRVEGR